VTVPPPPTDEALREALEAALREPVVSLRRAALEDASTYPIEALEVSTANRARPLSVVFKDITVARRQGRPGTEDRPIGVEATIWSEVLPRAGVRSARYVGVSFPPGGGRAWLFLERVPARPLHEFGDEAAWTSAAGWIGEAHRRTAACAPALATRGDLPVLDGRWHEASLARAREAATRECRPVVASVARHWATVVERLHASAPTVVHGEFYPSNILVRRVRGSFRVYPIDWETAAVGPRGLDLAALATGARAELRERLLAEYADAAGTAVDRHLRGEVAAARVRLAVQWLGRHSEWSPPPEHRFDWASEALAALQELVA
jgi:hypothetical protein